MLPNMFDAHRMLLAVGWLRGIEVPLNPAHVGSTLEYCLNLTDVTMLVTTAAGAARVRGLASGLPTLRDVVILDGEPTGTSPFRTIGRSAFLSGARPARDLEGPAYSDIAALLFTSGTTGPSKAVVTPWAVVHQ